MKLKFYRHATFEMFLGPNKVLVDPMFMPGRSFWPSPWTGDFRRNPLINFPSRAPESGNEAVLITHHHFDHFDRQAAKLLQKEVHIISPRNGTGRLQRMGFRNVNGIAPGQQLTVNDILITAIPVKHAERFDPLLYKKGVGYIVERGSDRIYISGDTILFDELPRLLERFRISLAILYGGAATLPFWGRHTLSFAEIRRLLEYLRPANAVIMHLDTLTHCREDRKRYLIEYKELSDQGGLILPVPGEEFVFETDNKL
ncbi:MAG: hypothetical protein A2W25_06060 [candidate division Zixibacteria bacterium RBG_16_53_22]|nr:MAG: hypothetical protein A2W25_06060 [candidate division Zixibacteria bacterium RBG_16_53_22]